LAELLLGSSWVEIVSRRHILSTLRRFQGVPRIAPAMLSRYPDAGLTWHFAAAAAAADTAELPTELTLAGETPALVLGTKA
jgi:hypothetical protein